MILRDAEDDIVRFGVAIQTIRVSFIVAAASRWNQLYLIPHAYYRDLVARIRVARNRELEE